jgi:outer membrane protein assembly factor BamB
MTIAQSDALPARKPLRLWPGVVIVAVQWLLRFGVPVIAPDAMIVAMLGGLFGGVALIVWWVFFSRAPWPERIGAVGLMITALFATSRLLDVSIATGAQRMLFPILATPVLSLAFVVWAVATRRLAGGPRRATMVATIFLACGFWTLVRTGGFSSNFDNDLKWRWAKTPEDRLLAQAVDEPTPTPAAAKSPETPLSSASSKEGPEKRLRADAAGETVAPPSPPIEAKAGASWPGFRGSDRDGVVRGVQIKTDWTASPPVELWRRPVGPGWSSFAVAGGLLYTQEQRGDDEIVACYSAATGKLVWRHRDAARFWESNAGAGPRATPTLSNGRVYSLGATGIVNVLDARDGALVWSRSAAADTGAKLPDWGFSGSPLVAGESVIVAASGRLAAYDAATGKPRWFGPAAGASYSSPQLLTIDGVPQVLLLSSTGATSVALADGTLLWQHQWQGYPIVQPALTAEGDILISVSDNSGIRRLAVAHGDNTWSVKERWTSNGLKPYFNDFVVHKGHAFGFDGRILACIDLADGRRKWKGGRYGQGQLVLLPDQDLLLVLSEEGELALVRAATDHFTEVARRPAIEGKTWNHPVLSGDVLLVRNAEEMAAFRLAFADR